jgi:hypothetical protein
MIIIRFVRHSASFHVSFSLIIAMHSLLLSRLTARLSRRTILATLDYKSQYCYSTIYANKRYRLLNYRTSLIIPTTLHEKWMPVMIHNQLQRSYASLPVDTYRLVAQLENRGFTRKQAEIIMKAMCGLLTHR